MASQRIKHKVGDTFDAAGLYRDQAGQPVNLTAAGITIKSAMLDSAGRLYATVATILDQAVYPGQFQITASTDQWPAEDELQWDVQFTQGGHVHSSPTVIIVTLPDVTPA